MTTHRTPRPTGRVTISDIAERTGVSRSTVARAFTRPEMIAQTTVDRIRAVADELGYIGNHAAKALSTGRFGNIAVIVPDIANPFFSPLVRSVQSVADEGGVAVFLGDSDESAEREERLSLRLRPQVDGFVLAAARLSEQAIRTLAASRPVVLINRDIPGLPRVLVDPQGGLTEAVIHLAERGHTSLVYLAGPRDSWSDQYRRAVLAEAVDSAGLHLEVIELGRPSYSAGRDAVTHVVAGDATAVIAFDDVVAQGVLAGFAVRGIDVPGAYSVIGCDDTLAAGSHPPLTTISAGAAAAGEVAAQVLLRLVEDPDSDQSEPAHRVPTHLVVRASTGPAPHDSSRRGRASDGWN